MNIVPLRETKEALETAPQIVQQQQEEEEMVVPPEAAVSKVSYESNLYQKHSMYFGLMRKLNL